VARDFHLAPGCHSSPCKAKGFLAGLVKESNVSAQEANTCVMITNIDRSVYVPPRDWIKNKFACEINALIEIEGDRF
jgi:hypothetical protein